MQMLLALSLLLCQEPVYYNVPLTELELAENVNDLTASAATTRAAIVRTGPRAVSP